ncbi:MAG: FG-GAP-like repeat-containing protein [Pyrinomonadaceae bacterium]
MKKIILSTAVLALILGALVLVGTGRWSLASAQVNSSQTRPGPQDGDRELGRLISDLTDRTDSRSIKRTLPDGGVEVDMGMTFQNVMLARLGTDGEPVAACVSDLGEAENFLGRDLFTGAKIQSHYPDRTEVANEAARHGMSPAELIFYKNLIAEAAQRRALQPNSATITIVNGDGAGEGFNDPTAAAPEGGNDGTTRGQQRLNLFNFAASIWGAFLDTTVPIEVNSQFNSLSPCSPSGGVLGSAGATSRLRDFASAPVPGTWYSVALANKLAGTPLNLSNPEINAQFNSDVDNGCLGSGSRFYYGLNNSTPANRINLLVVLLHEMGHGLGFQSFVNGSTGEMPSGFPDAYLRFMFDTTTGKRWSEMTDLERRTSATNNNNVVFDGPNVRIASSFLTACDDASGRVQLYTPSTFQGGSSISHFNTACSPNLLMEPNINVGLPLTLDLTRHVMRDIGWYRDSNNDNVRDTITNVSPASGSVAIGSNVNITWTNTSGFDRNVTIELSTDGGTTFPTVIANDVANSGSRSWTVPNIPTSSARIRVREAGFIDPAGTSSANFTIGTSSTPTGAAMFDFDGDGKTDVSVYRPSNSVWYLQRSTAGFTAYQFGAAGDKMVPADFTGDGKTDVAMYRPSTGTWYILRSEDLTLTVAPFGISTDIPTPGDFDGDGKADMAVYRPDAQGTFYIQRSTLGFTAVQFGLAGDRPTTADFDGDGKADIAVYRPSTGVWYRFNSANGAFWAAQFGAAGDKIVPADYTGDGKTDLAVYRPSTGFWYILRSENDTAYGAPFGIATDIPAAGDYDGDGKADLAVYRPDAQGLFYILGTSAGFSVVPFGLAGDTPAPSAYVN